MTPFTCQCSECTVYPGGKIAPIMFTGENTAIHGVILELEEPTLTVHVLQHAGPGHKALPCNGWDRE